MTPYMAHFNKWIDCKDCFLHKRRKNVVLARGTIPCDVLFVGEAPGAGEDVLGVPFVGPAGKLLDEIIESAWPSTPGVDRSIAFSNILACIPKASKGNKIHSGAEIPEECLDACSGRLTELVNLCIPKVIVLVGQLAKKRIHGQAQFGSKWEGEGSSIIHFVEIIHPAAILRMDISKRGLAVQRTVVALSYASREIWVEGVSEAP